MDPELQDNKDAAMDFESDDNSDNDNTSIDTDYQPDHFKSDGKSFLERIKLRCKMLGIRRDGKYSYFTAILQCILCLPDLALQISSQSSSFGTKLKTLVGHLMECEDNIFIINGNYLHNAFLDDHVIDLELHLQSRCGLYPYIWKNRPTPLIDNFKRTSPQDLCDMIRPLIIKMYPPCPAKEIMTCDDCKTALITTTNLDSILEIPFANTIEDAFLEYAMNVTYSDSCKNCNEGNTKVFTSELLLDDAIMEQNHDFLFVSIPRFELDRKTKRRISKNVNSIKVGYSLHFRSKMHAKKSMFYRPYLAFLHTGNFDDGHWTCVLILDPHLSLIFNDVEVSVNRTNILESEDFTKNVGFLVYARMGSKQTLDCSDSLNSTRAKFVELSGSISLRPKSSRFCDVSDSSGIEGDKLDIQEKVMHFSR
jgi:hypothetical protein